MLQTINVKKGKWFKPPDSSNVSIVKSLVKDTACPYSLSHYRKLCFPRREREPKLKESVLNAHSSDTVNT